MLPQTLLRIMHNGIEARYRFPKTGNILPCKIHHALRVLDKGLCTCIIYTTWAVWFSFVAVYVFNFTLLD